MLVNHRQRHYCQAVPRSRGNEPDVGVVDPRVGPAQASGSYGSLEVVDDSVHTESVRVLIIDDSPEVVETLRPVLIEDGHELEVADNGRAGLELLASFQPEVVLLDVVLPEIDGIEVCRRLRGWSDAHVIMLTSKDHEVDRVVGLSVGADDYVTKPFFPREVSARIGALARRAHAPMVDSGATVRVFADLRIETEARRVTVAGEEVALTKKEFGLLDAITSRPKIVHTREMLRERIWGEDWFGDDHVVDVHVANLRKKIDKGRSDSRIETIRGVGFRLQGGGTYGDAAGNADGVIASVGIADEQAETERSPQRLASTDTLTGLVNGAEAFARLEAALNKPRSPGPYQGLLFCDVDHFKDINDTRGHAVGDAVLATVAARIRECIRAGDTVGRVDGDKMLVLLPGVHDLGAVVKVAEKIRCRAAEPIQHSGQSIHPTLSLGATIALPGESATVATDRADAAVYRAKKSGRNVVIGIDATQHR